MKIKCGKIEEIITSNIIRRLDECADFPISVSVKLSEFLIELSGKIDTFIKNRNRLIERYAERDSNGNLKSDERGMCIFGNNLDKYAEEITELYNTELSMKCDVLTIKMSDVPIGLLSPRDIRILKGIVEFIEDEK